jgi:hypothetical protein
MNEDWKVRELTEALRRSEANAAKDRSYIEQLRLELDKHRWIPITERMPTIEDAYNGMVLIKSFSGDISTAFITHLGTYTHDHIEKWQRINYPN